MELCTISGSRLNDWQQAERKRKSCVSATGKSFEEESSVLIAVITYLGR